MSIRGYSTTYVVLCVIAVLVMFCTQLINPLLAIYAREVGATGIWIGLSVSAYWIARVLLEIPSGIISTKYGYYLPIVVGLVLTAAGNLLLVFVLDPVQLIVARLLLGLGAPLFFAVSMTLIINMFSIERRGSAMGLFQGIEFLGSTIASTFSGYIISELSFKGSFYLSTAMAVVGIALALMPRIRNNISNQPKSSSVDLSSMPSLFKNKDLLTVCGVTFMNFILYQGVLFTTYPLYLNGDLKMSLTDIGLIQGARSIGYVISMLFLGAISDRIGRKPVLLFGTLGTAFMCLVLNYLTGFFAIMGGMFLIGVTTGAVWIICPVIAAEVVKPSSRGGAVGIYRTSFDIGSVFGPMIMMWVVGVYGNTMSFIVSSVLLFIVFLPSIWLKETMKK
jgi:MFS family permease